MAYDKSTMQDITLNDKDLYLQYNAYITAGDFTNANLLLSNNPTLKYKVFNAENRNRLNNIYNDAIAETQTTPYVPPTNDSLVGQWVNGLGNIVYIGEYTQGDSYKQGNLVTNNNMAYIALQDTTATLSTTTDWLQVMVSDTPYGLNVVSTQEQFDDLRIGDVYYQTL